MTFTVHTRYLFEGHSCIGSLSRLYCGELALTPWISYGEASELGRRLAQLSGCQLGHLQLSRVELTPLPELPLDSCGFSAVEDSSRTTS